MPDPGSPWERENPADGRGYLDMSKPSPTVDDELVARLWLATKHGDEDHQAWLREAYTAFFAGQAVPEPRGRGNKEALQARLERYREAVVSRERVIEVMAGALDEADKIIAVNCGMDTPKSWDRAFRAVQTARKALSDSTEGEG